jgi:hypothetical protein
MGIKLSELTAATEQLTMTGCECKCAGWCERHKVEKTETWFRLCKTRDKYFAMWEEGRGPGQKKNRNEPETPKFPPVHRQAWNLITSLAAFVADGFKTVTHEVYVARLNVCDTCSHRYGNRCRLCGCGLTAKAKGRAFKCPARKWEQ